MTEPRKPADSPAQEAIVVAWVALFAALVSLSYCYRHGLLLLYGDAVAHLYIARTILDSRNPGFRQLGSVWLPLPHLLFLPFVQVRAWWQSGLAAAWVSIPSYVLACAGLYRLARVWMPRWISIVAVAFFGLNPGLLYMSGTAMTEPLYLAETIWATLLIVLFESALADAESKGKTAAKMAASAPRLLLGAGLVLVGAIFTRYDGWIFASVAWIFVTCRILRRPRPRRDVVLAWVAFTAMLIAAPLVWIGYNSAIFGDPLNFLRGPYSARAIEARTTRPGSPGHPGAHNMRVAEMYFLKAGELGVVPRRYGDLLLWLFLAGVVAAILRFRRGRIWPAFLLLVPMPFYAYSIAYGSVPIFIPLWWPFSWYNTRYGMEMLPAFAFFCACFVAVLVAPLVAGSRKREEWTAALLLLLIALDSIALLRSGPLVFEEAVKNSRTRIPFEHALTNAMLQLPEAGVILMYTSQDAGVLQQSGISLHRIINEGDYREWRQALQAPAHYAAWIIALQGDPVAAAVAKHPQGLELVKQICSSGQPCARIYRSELYSPHLQTFSP